MKSRAPALLIAALSTLLLTVQAYTQEDKNVRSTTAVGYGTVIAGDVAKARDDALSDAMRKAVENVMGLMVEAESISENYQLVEDNIFSRTSGYIHSYNVTSEKAVGGGIYEVTIEASVKVSELESDLDGIGILMRRIGMPRLIVLISEDVPDVVGGLGVAENAVIAELKKKGFEFLDMETVRRKIDESDINAAMGGNENAAMLIGEKMKGEVIVVGEAVARKAELGAMKLGGMQSFQADITLRAVKADNGVVIAEATGHGAYPHINAATGATRAIGKAAADVTGTLVTKMLDAWQTEVSAGRSVILKISNVASFTQLNKFKGSLKYYVRGVRDVQNRSFDGTNAELDVRMTGSAEKLAQELDGKKIEDFNVRVTGLSANTVMISLSE